MHDLCPASKINQVLVTVDDLRCVTVISKKQGGGIIRLESSTSKSFFV